MSTANLKFNKKNAILYKLQSIHEDTAIKHSGLVIMGSSVYLSARFLTDYSLKCGGSFPVRLTSILTLAPPF